MARKPFTRTAFPSGNSIAVTIPEWALEELDIEAGDEIPVDLDREDGRLILG